MTMIAPKTVQRDLEDYSRIVEANVVDDTLRVSFADGNRASVLIAAFENAFIQEQRLNWSGARASLHEVVVPAENGEEIGIPWDTIRALSDPDFQQRWSEMSQDVARRLGIGLRSLRSARGISVDELARRSNLPIERVEQVENGELPANLDVAEQLLTAMSLSLDDLDS